LRWTGGDDVSAALSEHAGEIADEVLAVGITEDATTTDPSTHQFWDDALGLRFSLAKA
jgi:hypothetical protein